MDFFKLIEPSVANEICKKCNHICYAMRFQQKFINWTSGNNYIDKFIQDTQLSAHDDVKEALEWIPYDRLYNIKYITKNEFGKVYRANWIDGNININYSILRFGNKNDKSYWNDKNQNWKRESTSNMFVNLKNLNIPNNLTLEFTNEIKVEHIFYGITQDPETKNYMMVLNNKCKRCDRICNSIHLQHKFIDWTSGNDCIDIFIQNTQLSVHGNASEVLEWIPYDRFYNIKHITSGGFGKVYKANWIDGRIQSWNEVSQNWHRKNHDMIVALKTIYHNKGKEDNLFFIGFYGITQDSETKNYIMVLEYAEGGSLRNHLDKEYSKLNWDIKIGFLQDAISGLKCVHEKGLIHRDLHSGNILKVKYNAVITDMGLCKPENHIAVENAKSYVYVFSGLPPYHDISHNNILAIKICQGLRPRYNIKVPQLIVDLIKRCLDSDPLNRPKAEEIETILCAWLSKPNDNQTIELQAQIKAADEINNNLIKRSVPSTSLGSFYVTYSEAIYTSRLLSFNNLPEPKNSDDYYEQNDNIISKEFSDSLQIDISQLNINLKFLFVRPIISDVHFVLPMV
ncbi:hypothetical protein RclHR1_01140020 [Rhizophagus clarus]|uniref:Protein kinase domain-containing protein n=1 Tax=Rhizophagus clarus TaxID=94130 RepID=A0A2Z6QJB4_9GLOM|nr:hypothetical protein RclHR1_01140020 [Rhizophagus clarus]